MKNTIQTLFVLAIAIASIALARGAVAQPAAQPGQVALQWDPSPTAGARYRLYAYTNAANYTNLTAAPVRIDAGTNLVALVHFLQPGTWRFAATAYSTNGLESVPSNELVATMPAAPANARTIVAQWSGQVAGTNWIDVGFLRLKFGD